MKILYRSYDTDVTTDVNPIPVIYRIKLFNKLTIWKSKKTIANLKNNTVTFSEALIKGATVNISYTKTNVQAPNRAQRRHPQKAVI